MYASPIAFDNSINSSILRAYTSGTQFMTGITEKAQAVLSLVAGTGALAIGSHIVSAGHEMFNSPNSELAAANATWLDSTTVAVDALAILSGINLASAASKYSAETSEYMPNWLQISLGISQACTIATPLMLSKIGETISVALETGDIVKACQAVLMGAVIITAGVSNGVAAVKNFSRPKPKFSVEISKSRDQSKKPKLLARPAVTTQDLLPPDPGLEVFAPIPVQKTIPIDQSNRRPSNAEVWNTLSWRQKSELLRTARKLNHPEGEEYARELILAMRVSKGIWDNNKKPKT